MRHISNTKHTAADELSWQPKMKDETDEEEDINDSINTELNIVQISVLQVDNLENPVLKSEYLIKYYKITFFLTLLIKPENMSQTEYQDFKKRALWYIIQGAHLFCCQERNVSLWQVVDPSIK